MEQGVTVESDATVLRVAGVLMAVVVVEGQQERGETVEYV